MSRPGVGYCVRPARQSATACLTPLVLSSNRRALDLGDEDGVSQTVPITRVDPLLQHSAEQIEHAVQVTAISISSVQHHVRESTLTADLRRHPQYGQHREGWSVDQPGDLPPEG